MGNLGGGPLGPPLFNIWDPPYSWISGWVPTRQSPSPQLFLCTWIAPEWQKTPGNGWSTVPNPPFCHIWPYGSPMGPYGSPMGPYGSPMGPYGSPMGPYGSLWEPYGALWGPYGPLWGPYGAPMGSLWVPMGPYMVHIIPKGALFGDKTLLFNKKKVQKRTKITFFSAHIPKKCSVDGKWSYRLVKNLSNSIILSHLEPYFHWVSQKSKALWCDKCFWGNIYSKFLHFSDIYINFPANFTGLDALKWSFRCYKRLKFCQNCPLCEQKVTLSNKNLHIRSIIQHI